MGIFDSMKEKAEELLGNGKAEELLAEHADKVEELSDQGIEKAGDAIDGADRPGSEHARREDW